MWLEEGGNKRKDKEARGTFRGLALSPRRARTSNFQSSNYLCLPGLLAMHTHVFEDSLEQNRSMPLLLRGVETQDIHREMSPNKLDDGISSNRNN